MKGNVTRFYAEYWMWEDYINGMYDGHSSENESDFVYKAIKILSNPNLFDAIIPVLFKNWKISTAVNLTNPYCNRRAWVGQASCSILYRIPETATRIAWASISDTQKDIANKIAEKHISSYLLKYERKDTPIHF